MVGTLLLIVASLYWARAVLMPVALALLLTFLLSPLTARSNASAWVGCLGHVAAVLTFSVIGSSAGSSRLR